jgi:hypothetical protein
MCLLLPAITLILGLQVVCHGANLASHRRSTTSCPLNQALQECKGLPMDWDPSVPLTARDPSGKRRWTTKTALITTTTAGRTRRAAQSS